MRFGGNGLREPCLNLVLPALGDGVALAFRTGPRLGLSGGGFAVTRQASERGIDLSIREGPPAAEVVVVVAFQVIPVAGFTIEEPEEGHRNAHIYRAYAECILAVNAVGDPERPMQ
jgi:hypothetical protein